MTLVRAVRDDDHFPEYGLIVLRDDGYDGDDDGEGILEEYDSEAHPGGTVAVAGEGWLYANATSDGTAVRLELHDAEPPLELDTWEDVMETPLLVRGGVVALEALTGGGLGPELELPGAGRYRVRVARRWAEGVAEWALCFWADPGGTEPPRFLRRKVPAVAAPPSDWDDLLPHEPRALLWFMDAVQREHGAVTVALLEAWGREHGRGADWLDRPLWPEPASGEPDPYSAAQRSEITDLAAQLGVQDPATLRGFLPFHRAAGLLAGDLAAGFRVVEVPPSARKVLRLLPERLAFMDLRADIARYAKLAADLTALARWSAGGVLEASSADLADRLLTEPWLVDEALDFAAAKGLLEVGSDASGRLTLAFPYEDGPDDEGF
ncbi:hypothetical protein [Actinocorallia longicatena]|uniref:Uncharacterized protein n=1 Tax=Actinocorallia longicatena TaxID=111803 RepID=A0ABP6QFR3_9ACTN